MKKNPLPGWNDRHTCPACLYRLLRVRMILGLLLSLGSLLLFACVPSTITPTPNPSQDALSTEIAQTVIARQTLEAGFTAVARLTEIAQGGGGEPGETAGTPVPVPGGEGGAGGSGGGIALPTLPPAPPSLTPTPSATPTPFPTPTSTPTLVPCDQAAFVAHISAPPDTILPPGVGFTKVWRLQNIGVCTWTPNYSLILVGGYDFQSGGVASLPAYVEPGQLVDVAVDMVAPIDPGVYTGDWMLRSSDGDFFGTGLDANGTVPVRIEVVRTAQQGGFNLAENICQARWQGPNGTLPCPGDINDFNGSINLLTQPDLESRSEDELALWVRPAVADGSWVVGRFPAFRVQDGDHFRTEIGCLDDNPDCHVIFQLDYALETGLVRNLGTWVQVYDGETEVLELDLSRLEGLSIELILSVQNVDSGRDANAFWFVPHIRNFGGTTELMLAWRHEGGPAEICEELRLYLLDLETSEAQALDCDSDNPDLGRMRLSEEQHSRLMDWVTSLQPFEVETYTPTTGEAEIVTVSFNGWGDAEAFSNDVEALRIFATGLYNSIVP